MGNCVPVRPTGGAAALIEALRRGDGRTRIVIPEIAVEEAARTGCDLAVACAMLTMETSGGRNVWGNDQVDTGGIYVKGTEVDRDTYLRYRDARLAGRIKTQGVGPAQLTYYSFQDQADAIGGCWDPRINCRVGFGILAGYLRGGSIRDALTQYNKGKPGDSPYATKALPLVAQWREVLTRVEY